MNPVLHRKRKLSVSGPATKETLVKKFREEIEAEKRKKSRLEWYLKQLLLEKEMLVKENRVEFAKAYETSLDEAPVFSSPVPVVPTSTASTIVSSAPLSMDLPPSLRRLPSSEGSPVTEARFSFGSSASTAYNPFLAVPPPAPLTTDNSTATAVDQRATGDMSDPLDVSSFFSSSSLLFGDEETKPSSMTTLEEPSSFFSAEWEQTQTHCWWADEDELSQLLAVPPSLMV